MAFYLLYLKLTKRFHSFRTDFAYFLFQNTSHSYVKSLEHATNLVWVTWGRRSIFSNGTRRYSYDKGDLNACI